MKNYIDRYKYDLRATIKLAVPVIVGQLGQMMMSIVDSAMVGRLGKVPLAAAVLANMIFFLVLVMGIGIAQGVTPLVAQSIGAKQPERCGPLLRKGLLVCTGSGILLGVVSFGLSYFIPFLNQPAEVVPEATSYLQIVGTSILPIMVFYAYRQYSEGLSIMWPAMILTIAANLLNVFLNWVFIYGHFGFPAMGLKGAGYSTLGTRTVMAIAMIAYVTKARRYEGFRAPIFKNFFPLDWGMIRTLVKLGFATGSQYVFEIGAFTGATIIIGWLGSASLAAHQVAISASGFSFMFSIGLSAAAAVRVGNAKGEQNIPGMRRAGISSFGLSVATMAFFAVLFAVFRFSIPRIFIRDPEVIGLAAGLLLVVALYQVPDGLQCVGLGSLRGMSDVKVPTIITFVSYWIIGLPAAYVLGFPLGLNVLGIWIGLSIGLVCAAVLLTVRFHRRTRRS
ncbi:MAG: MATE family efflux transporter [bacterium]|nr:MATE family efflux transporter [bacterium]